MQRELTVAFPWQQCLRERAGNVSPRGTCRAFSLHPKVQKAFRVQPSIQGVPDIFVEVKRPQNGVKHLIPSIAVVMNEWSSASTPQRTFV